MGCLFCFLRGTLSPLDTPPVPEKPGAITPSRPHGGRGRAATARAAVRKSGTRPDFLGEFYAACCGRPVRPPCRRQVWAEERTFMCAASRRDASSLPTAGLDGLSQRHASACLFRALRTYSMESASQIHKNRGRVPRLLYCSPPLRRVGCPHPAAVTVTICFSSVDGVCTSLVLVTEHRLSRSCVFAFSVI